MNNIRISTLYFYAETNQLYIGYKNGNIDVLKEGEIYNIPALKLASIPYSKKINSSIFVSWVCELKPSVENVLKMVYFLVNGNQSDTTVKPVFIIDLLAAFGKSGVFSDNNSTLIVDKNIKFGFSVKHGDVSFLISNESKLDLED